MELRFAQFALKVSCLVVLGFVRAAPAGGTTGETAASFVEADSVIPSQKPAACKPQLLLLILSDVRDQTRRETIRQSLQSWVQQHGKEHDGFLQYYFVVGRLHATITEASIAEATKHKDLIVADQNDYDYELGTSKVLWALRWATKHCQFSTLLKLAAGDFVNVRLLATRWSQLTKIDQLTGSVVQSASPIRNEDNPYYMPKEYYPADGYPGYAERSYAMPFGLVKLVADTMTKEQEKVYYDDVAVGSVLAKENKAIVPSSLDSGFVHARRGVHDKCSAAVILEVTDDEMRHFSSVMMSSKTGAVC